MTTTVTAEPLALSTLANSRTDLCRAFARTLHRAPRVVPGDCGPISQGWDDALDAIADDVTALQIELHRGASRSRGAELHAQVRADLALRAAEAITAQVTGTAA